jgi:hypothetical protein
MGQILPESAPFRAAPPEQEAPGYWMARCPQGCIGGWSADIDQVVVRNDLFDVETVFFHRASGTAIFTDLIQHFDRTWFKGWRAFIARLDLMTAPEAEVPRKFRLPFFRSRTARAAVKHILQWPIERVLMAHGKPITRKGHEFVVQRFRWLNV